MYITFVWKIRFEQIQHFLSTLIIFCAVPDVPRWLTGGLVSLLLLMFIILIVYKMFKIELVLWYRNSGCAFVSKEGMWMWPMYVSVTSLLLFIFFSNCYYFQTIIWLFNRMYLEFPWEFSDTYGKIFSVT